MEKEGWQKVKAIFSDALAVPAVDRLAYLDHAAADGTEIRSEVDRLLNAYQSGFLEDSAIPLAAEALADSGLTTGQVIGRYKIAELVGTGGMGEVFRADDTELDRSVAFKVLHRDVAEDEERVRRFIQEAKAASALNHPNILTIHEIGTFEGSRYIVSEYIDGATLREKMHGGLTTSESVEISCQMAAALQAAHSAGIVHRDIKPENVMIRKDGLVKVLDFGLAKLTEADDLPLDASAPLSRIHTSPGLVMGTVAYMSPEQAKGQPVDARTDLWSLGVVLHEMLTGSSPFEGDSVTELISSIVKKDTSPARLETLPSELRPICQKALTKDKDSRYRSAHDLLKDLEGEKKRMEYAIQPTPYISSSSTDELKTQLIRPRPTLSAEYIVTSVKRHKYTAVLTFLTVALALGVTAYRYNGTPSGSTNGILPVIADSTTEGDLNMTRLPTSGSVNNVAISPDGKYIAYTPRDGAGKGTIRMRTRETGSDVELVPAPAVGSYWALNFSSSSDALIYTLAKRQAPQEVYELPLRGGDPVKLQADADMDSGASMSPDGKMIAFVTEKETPEVPRQLVIQSPSGADRRVLLSTSGSDSWIDCTPMPSWSPDGKSLACWTVEKANGEQFERLYSVNVDDGKMRLLNDKKWRAITGLTYMPNGSMVIVAQDLSVQQSAPAQLWLIDTSGGARQITNDLTGYDTLSATRAGDVMVSLRVRDSADLWLMNGKDASQPRQVTSSGELADGGSAFTWTADGRILFSSLTSGNQDLWVMNPDGSGRVQLTRDNGTNDDAWMTKDGKYIVFVNRTNFINGHIYRMDADGRNIRQLTNGPLREWTPRLSLDGKWVYYVEVSNASQRICKVPIDGGEPITIARLNEKLNIWDVSTKDGRIILEYIPQSDAVRHVVILAPDGVLTEGSTGWPSSAVKFDLPSNAGGVLRFTPDGKYIAFRGKVDGRAAVSMLAPDGTAKPKLMFFLDDPYHGFRWSPDGKQLANVKRTNMSDAIVITNTHN